MWKDIKYIKNDDDAWESFRVFFLLLLCFEKKGKKLVEKHARITTLATGRRLAWWWHCKGKRTREREKKRWRREAFWLVDGKGTTCVIHMKCMRPTKARCSKRGPAYQPIRCAGARNVFYFIFFFPYFFLTFLFPPFQVLHVQVPPATEVQRPYDVSCESRVHLNRQKMSFLHNRADRQWQKDGPWCVFNKSYKEIFVCLFIII